MNPQATWHLLSTRPDALNAPLSLAVSSAGGSLIPLESMDIETRLTDDTVTRLLSALRESVVVFTSPTAVNVAAEVLDLPGALNRRIVVATGAGTQKTLVNRGVRQARAPDRMDSEGLLGMPVLTDVDGVGIGLVTGEGGRGMLQPSLIARGARVTRADIYARVPRTISAAEWDRVCAAEGMRILAITSAEAFEALLPQIPEAADFAQWRFVVGSRRLMESASSAPLGHLLHVVEKGFCAVARSPMPEDLVHAALALLET